MLRGLVYRIFDAGEVESPAGRALVEERYAALRQQIPIIYVIALVGLCGVEITTTGTLAFGFNVPTVVAACAAVRISQWLRSPTAISAESMLKRLQHTCWFAMALCAIVCWWCLQLRTADSTNAMGVMLFGSLTAIGVSYGLTPLPAAARLPLLMLALPLAATALMSNDPQSIGAALSLLVVAVLMLRLLEVNNSHFTGVIESRSIIARQQELAEAARQEAFVAATTDFLTGLPNRRAFVAALETEFERPPGRVPFAVGILDLDRFKAVNDTFGHATGDLLLCTVAERLLEAARGKALVARLGGDEFGLLFHDVGGESAAREAAAGILAAVNRLAVVEGSQFAISVCCGVTIARTDSERTPSRILADADLALYEAKDRSDGGAVLFEPWMEAPRRRRAQIERALQRPQVEEQVDLVFQPIVDLRSGRIIANEALARWTDNDLGEVSPAEFVPVAEQLNVIGKLSDHLMEKAFAEAAQWPSSVRLSFNLSAVQLCAADSALLILQALKRAQLSTDRLQVEVTETALLRDLGRANDNLSKLRDAGVTIVLDDFGAGYASISYLKELRFDQIKIDGGLLTAALDSAEGKRLLSAVIGLCHALGVGTVAEHVENERQLRLLMTLGCVAGQGYWLQPPMSASRCRDYSKAGALVFGAKPPELGHGAA
jgi:diguanylate cyclase (GGDEF)-like protein